MKINNILHHNLIDLYGKRGEQWLNDLPILLQQYERELKIKIHAPFANLTYNYVAPATLSDDTFAVFKCGIPNKELTSEIAALKHFNGNGAARLISANANAGWLLLEKLEPGIMLSTLEDDDEAMRIAINVMQKLNKPTENYTNFPTVQSWLNGFQRLYQQFNGGTGVFKREIVERADKLAKELLQSMGKVVLLHGDLHHDNILSNKHDSWLAIDPKGVIGEPEYEIGALMRNPIAKLMASRNLKELFLRRTAITTELTGFDRQKILAWSFVQSVLAAWWIFEDNCGDTRPFLHCAEVLNECI